MEWIERLNESIHYIEEHLTEEIDYEQLGRIACCSAYHFQRMFTYMAGVTLSEYIRRRKMSLAAVDLQGGDTKVVDIAAKYGYQSPTAFNRAFQSIHGVAPSAVRNEGVSAPLHREIEDNFMIVPRMWENAAGDGTMQKLAGMMDTPLKGLLGVSVCNDEEEWIPVSGSILRRADSDMVLP